MTRDTCWSHVTVTVSAPIVWRLEYCDCRTVTSPPLRGVSSREARPWMVRQESKSRGSFRQNAHRARLRGDSQRRVSAGSDLFPMPSTVHRGDRAVSTFRGCRGMRKASAFHPRPRAEPVAAARSSDRSAVMRAASHRFEAAESISTSNERILASDADRRNRSGLRRATRTSNPVIRATTNPTPSTGHTTGSSPKDWPVVDRGCRLFLSLA